MSTTKYNQLIDWAARHGYQKDRYGHWQKITADGKRYRLKFQTQSLRREVWSESLKEWIRLSSGHYGQIRITADDRIQGLKY